MKYALLAAAAAASLFLAGCGSNYYSDRTETSFQSSGGRTAESVAAPTGNISGSQTGAANMNGPNRDGRPVDPELKNGDPVFIDGY